jgi:hypothetical protein
MKGMLFFLAFNFAFMLVPDSFLWKFTLFNTILPGRPRFRNEGDLDLLFNAHEIASSSRRDEYRVVVLGDSSTWGVLLNEGQTFTSLINAGDPACGSRPIHVYNLGYPKLSVFKDLILLRRAMQYQPDLILWNITLNSMLKEPQKHPIVDENRALARELIDRYHLDVELGPATRAGALDRTFLGRRNDIARFISYQLDGIRWQAAGDEVEKDYKPLELKVSPNPAFNGLKSPLDPTIIQFDVLRAGAEMAGDVPLIVINEPIQIVPGKNSEIRYNRNYPRWAYDQYRSMLAGHATPDGWTLVDLWDIVPPTEFTDSTIHRSPAGEQIFAQAVREIILQNLCP